MGFLDKIKNAANSVAEKTTEALKDSGILVTGFEPIPPEIKNLPQGGRIRGGKDLPELMKNIQPDADGQIKPFNVCVHDGVIYVVERGRLWLKYNISDLISATIKLDGTSESEKVIRYKYELTLRLKDVEEPLIYEDGFAVSKEPSSTYVKITSDAFERIDRILEALEILLFIEPENVPIISDYVNIVRRVTDNNYVWTEKNQEDPDE